PRVVLDRVGVHRLAVAAVHPPVGLVVALEVHAPHRHPTRHRRLPDARRDLTPVPLGRTRHTDVHRHHRRIHHRPLCRIAGPDWRAWPSTPTRPTARSSIRPYGSSACSPTCATRAAPVEV